MKVDINKEHADWSKKTDDTSEGLKKQKKGSDEPPTKEKGDK